MVKIARTVLLLVVMTSAKAGCAPPAGEPWAGSTPSTGPSRPAPSRQNSRAEKEAEPVPTADVPVVGGRAEPSPLAAAAPRTEAVTGSAYVGCGQPIPPARLWDESSEGEVLEAITAAKTCAAKHGRRLLLEFVAPWCADCREMARIDQATVVTTTLQKRFERVRINVGEWERHEALRKEFDVRALATYIVIDPHDSRLLARTTLEPITRPGKRLSAEDWADWLRTH